jgi:4-aminobutyrate aminotransferase-like enzyme
MASHDNFERGIRLILESLADPAHAPPLLSRAQMNAALADLASLRGRPAFYPYLGSGYGRGARAMLVDGRWVLDFALGIGVHFFGHGNPDLVETALRAAASDVATQGNLIFNREYHALMKTLLERAPRGMEQCWLSMTGADANENALKLMRQHRDGRPGVVAFRGCFHGRTSATAEITDRPDYRLGQPSTFPVHLIPFYDRRDPDSPRKSLDTLRDVLRRDGDRIAAFFVELVQGEAGFVTAPRDFFVPLFEECRRAGVLILIDEIQTFGRTTELFATDMLGVADYADVTTVGKMLQGAAMLHRKSLAPDPGLISGTFSGATVPMAVGRRIVEKLAAEGFYGPSGRIKRLEQLTFEHLERLAKDNPGKVSHVDGVGAMISFRIGDGSLAATRSYIRRCFDAGLVLYYGGHDPACIRLFLPAGCLTDDELAEAFAILSKCL